MFLALYLPHSLCVCLCACVSICACVSVRVWVCVCVSVCEHLHLLWKTIKYSVYADAHVSNFRASVAAEKNATKFIWGEFKKCLIFFLTWLNQNNPFFVFRRLVGCSDLKQPRNSCDCCYRRWLLVTHADEVSQWERERERESKNSCKIRESIIFCNFFSVNALRLRVQRFFV